MFQCKIWSFGRSKSAKITQIRLLCPRLVSASPASTLGSPRVAPTNLAHRAHTPILICTESCSFSPSPSLPRAYAEPSSSSVPSPASPSAKLAAVPRFAAPQAAQPHPPPPSPHLVPVRANPGPNRPLRHRQPLPPCAGAPPLSSISHLRPSLAQIEGTVSILALSSPSPTSFPADSGATAAVPPRAPCLCRRAALRRAARHHRGHRGRLGPWPWVRPASAAGWPRTGWELGSNWHVGPGCQPYLGFDFQKLLFRLKLWKCISIHKKCYKCKLNFVSFVRFRTSEENYPCLWAVSFACAIFCFVFNLN